MILDTFRIIAVVSLTNDEEGFVYEKLEKEEEQYNICKIDSNKSMQSFLFEKFFDIVSDKAAVIEGLNNGASMKYWYSLCNKYYAMSESDLSTNVMDFIGFIVGAQSDLIEFMIEIENY